MSTCGWIAVLIFLGQLSHVSVCIRRSFTLPDRTNLPDSYLTWAKPTKTFNYIHKLSATTERFTPTQLKRNPPRLLLRTWLDFRSILGRIFNIKQINNRKHFGSARYVFSVGLNLKWYIKFFCDSIILKHLFSKCH